MKYFAIFVIIIFGFALIGCSSEEETVGKTIKDSDEKIPKGQVDKVSDADILSEVDDIWVEGSDEVNVGDLY